MERGEVKEGVWGEARPQGVMIWFCMNSLHHTGRRLTIRSQCMDVYAYNQYHVQHTKESGS